ncbi:hypothetical protein BJ878DRAFT_475669 [Calycina marina]|uniref:SprT-like domain-containing protein n=1 Tax=Calycina marina TaxID=1763456 RepID=A0A9P7ZCE8_9HELO|nr:hypothetical protein BJ878DRAFT_475669 [Calycina marina]
MWPYKYHKHPPSNGGSNRQHPAEMGIPHLSNQDGQSSANDQPNINEFHTLTEVAAPQMMLDSLRLVGPQTYLGKIWNQEGLPGRDDLIRIVEVFSNMRWGYLDCGVPSRVPRKIKYRFLCKRDQDWANINIGLTQQLAPETGNHVFITIMEPDDAGIDYPKLIGITIHQMMHADFYLFSPLQKICGVSGHNRTWQTVATHVKKTLLPNTAGHIHRSAQARRPGAGNHAFGGMGLLQLAPRSGVLTVREVFRGRFY